MTPNPGCDPSAAAHPAPTGWAERWDRTYQPHQGGTMRTTLGYMVSSLGPWVMLAGAVIALLEGLA